MCIWEDVRVLCVARKDQNKKRVARKSTIHRITMLVLTLFGIWPGTSYMFIFRTYWIAILLTDEMWHYQYFQAHLQRENLHILVECISTFMAHIKVLTKLFIFWSNQQKFVKILTMMTEDWNECADNDDDMRKTVYKAKISDRITVFVFIVHVIQTIIYSTSVFMADIDIDDSKFELPFLQRMQYPWRISTIRTYRLVLCAQFVYIVTIVVGTGLMNSLLLTLVLHLCGQIDILRFWLTEFPPKNSEQTHESIVIMMRKIIRKHQRIIQFSMCIENLYTYITLVLFTSNTMMICMLAFLVVISFDSDNAAEGISKSLMFYFITNLESFIFCFAGEYLRNKSRTIANAAYNSTWYNLKSHESRVLLLVILRAQKQLTLTAGKMADLSLECFANIMKASVSFTSVLLAMQ